MSAPLHDLLDFGDGQECYCPKAVR